MMHYRRFTGSANLRLLPRSTFTLFLEGKSPTPADLRALIAGLEYSTGAVIVRTHVFGLQVRLTIRPPLYIGCNRITFDK